MVTSLRSLRWGRRVALTWVKGHAGIPGNEKADVLARNAAEKAGSGVPVASLAYLKLKISERFRQSKEKRHDDPAHHGAGEIPPPPPKKSCLDHMGNALARTAAQNRTGHWKSAVYLKRIHKWTDDWCWFCGGTNKMTRSHVPPHFPNPKLRAARVEAWEGKSSGGVRVLLAGPCWERWFVRFLELSGVGRRIKDETDEYDAHAARMDK